MLVAGAKNSSVTATIEPPIAEFARSMIRRRLDHCSSNEHIVGTYQCIEPMGLKPSLHKQYVGKKREPWLSIVKVYEVKGKRKKDIKTKSWL
jgi:hypothetical protein